MKYKIVKAIPAVDDDNNVYIDADNIWYDQISNAYQASDAWDQKSPDDDHFVMDSNCNIH